MKVISSERIPIKIWADNLEESALEQAKNLANLPFAYKHVAIMADGHTGMGMPIGGVLATKGVVIPNAAGSDGGCGMCAVRTSLTDISRDTLEKIVKQIRLTIPVGFAHHAVAQSDSFMPGLFSNMPVIEREYDKATTQLGTLGGGNHFIEIQKSDEGYIWIMIHSGSRNLGKQVNDYYNDIAKEMNAKWHTSIKPELDLAFLPADSNEGAEYLIELQYCVDFALANRKLMMNRVKDAFDLFAGEDVEYDAIINIAHNYISLENHFGENVYVHRKGATLARQGTIGIIPGSQGTHSYIVKGKGYADSFMSCSHGAGRKMGRNAAKKALNLQEEIAKLDAQGIVHGIKTINDLDEASGAYKDIETVMENQSNLVDIIETLSPLAVVKDNTNKERKRK